MGTVRSASLGAPGRRRPGGRALRRAASKPVSQGFNFATEYPEISRWITGALCVYVLTWYLELGKRFDILAKVRFEWALGLTLTVIALMQPGLGRRIRESGMGMWIVLYLLSVVIQLPLSQDLALSWHVFMERFVKFGLMGVFVIAIVSSPTTLRWYIGAFLLALVKIGQEAFHGKVTGGMMWMNQGTLRLHGANGTHYGHPNSLSGNAIGTIPFIYYLFAWVPRWAKMVLLVQLVFAINIVIFTASRTGYVAFLALVLYFMLRSKKKFRMIAAVTLLAILAVPYIPEQYQERFNTLFTGKDKVGSSMEKRSQIFDDSIEVIKRYPWGVGVGAFPTVRQRMFGRVQDTHNLYTQIMTNLGIQGMVIFMGLVGATCRRLWQIERNLTDQIDRVRGILDDEARGRAAGPTGRQHLRDLGFMRAVASTLLAFLFVRLALGLFGHDLYEIYWWFAVGLTVALWGMQAVAARRTEELEQVAA